MNHGYATRTQPDRAEMKRILLPLVFVGLAASAVAAYWVFRPSSPEKAPSPSPQETADRSNLAREVEKFLDRRNFRPLTSSLEAILTDPKLEPRSTMSHDLLEQPAPDFTLTQVNGKSWTLSDAVKEGPVILVFYYGYYCDHCVGQLFALDKDLEKFRELGVTIAAMSPDPIETTQMRYKKYGEFGFTVLSDQANKVAQMYQTFKPSGKDQEGSQFHGTFVISRQGKVVWANYSDGPFTHNRTLLWEVARAEGRLPQKAN